MSVDLYIRMQKERFIITFYCASYTFDSSGENYFLNGIISAIGDLDHFGYKEGNDRYRIWMRQLDTIEATTKEIID